MLVTSRGHYIGGRWVSGQGDVFASASPFDETMIWSGRCATSAEVNMAVQAAATAFGAWSKRDPTERSAYLRAFVDVLKKNKAALAERISLEIGKPRWEAATEVAAMIGKLEPTEQAYQQRSVEFSRQQPNGTSRTRFRPHGVVAVLGPYNFPGHMPNGHIMPALLAGNTVIFKPSENGPSVAELTMESWSEAGLPSGVLNLLQGNGSVGRLLCQHPDTRGIFFTGSRRVGESISRSISMDKISALEMGGNSPLIVWDSSDIDAAVIATIQSAFVTTGQRCSSARRLIIPSSSFGEEFLARLVAATRRIRIGRYDDMPEPYIGPLRAPVMVDRLMEAQEELITRGGYPLVKCARLSYGPSFVTPGLIDVTNVNPRGDGEIMGPFLQVIRVEDFESALEEANATDFGLAAGVFTEDPELYERFQEAVRAGILNWNQQLTGASAWAPFGGIKHSGNFRPSGYLATDYCLYSTGSIELPKLIRPSTLPPGL